MADIEPASVLSDISITKTGILLLDADRMLGEVLVTEYVKWRFFQG